MMRIKIWIFLFFSVSNCFGQEKSSSKPDIIISGTMGYHSSYEEIRRGGFSEGIIFDLTNGIRIHKDWHIGLNLFFWSQTDEGIVSRGTAFNRESSAFAINFIAYIEHDLGRILLSYGSGLGRLSLTSKTSGGSDSEGYTNLKILFGAGYEITENLRILARLDADHSISIAHHSIQPSFFSIKIGPSYKFIF